MSVCKRVTKTNKNDSKLFNRLYLLANENEKLADEYYSYFDSSEFKNDFGDYLEDYKEEVSLRKISQTRVDDNGEPILFLDKNKDKYFYLNKENKKVYFPRKENKLKSIFSNKDINSITNVLAYHFIKHNSSNIINNFEDFNINIKLKESLKQNIKNKLNAKISEFSKSGDFHKETVAEYLQDSLKYLDEWVNEVNYKFRNLKLVYTEQFEEDELNEEEFSERGQSFDKASFETSYKQGVNSEVKLLLSFLQDPRKVDELLNEPIFLSFDEVYGTLLNALNTTSINEGDDIFNKYIDIINKYSKYKPYLKNLSRMLSSADENTKSKFVQAFRLNKINFLTTTISRVETKEGVTFLHTTQNMSSVGSKSKMVLEEWNVNFEKLYFNKNSVVSLESKAKLNTLLKDVNEFSLKFDKSTVEELPSNINLFLGILKKLGIETTQDGINFYLNSNSADELSDNDKLNNLRKLVTASKYLLERIQSGKINFTKSNTLNDQSEFDDLSKAEAWFVPEGSDASIFSAGKSKWTYSKPSYLSTKINLWKNNPTLLMQHYLSTPQTKSSYYMEYFLALDTDEENRNRVSKARLKKFDIGVFNSLQEEGDATNAVDNKELSENDQYADFVNKLLSFKKGAETWISTPTPADKNTQYEINYGDVFINSRVQFETIKVDNKVNIKITSLGGKVEDILFNYYKSEYERMKITSQEIEQAALSGDDSNLRVHYHLGNKNGLQSQIFQSLSPKFKGNTITLPNTNGLHLFDEVTGYPIKINDEYVNLDAFKDEIIQMILPLVEKNIIKTYSKLREINLFDINEEGETINNAIDSQIFESYTKEGNKTAGFRLSADAFINGLISQVEYSKMFSGDVAYYKNMVDYKKRIPATYTDGLQLRLGENDQIFNASVIEGVIIDIPEMKEMEKLVGKKIAKMYEGVNSTDAQAWITPQRWRFLNERMGKWSKKHDTVYKKMMDKKGAKFNEKELKILAQPLKGVYFEINSNVPVYLKYSQAVLLPNLIKGSQLETLYNKMVLDENGKERDYQHQVHELITIDGVKVGAIKPVKTHDDKGNILDNFELTYMQLKNSGWKLQQDLPIKGVHDTMVGSQIQKNIFQGLAFNLNETFKLGDVDINGQKLLDHINEIVGELSSRGLEDLISELDIADDGKINNVERFYSALSDELKERGGSRNILEALEAELSPYGIPQAQSKIINIFASLVNKKLVKIKTNGGSFIQMSNYGLNFKEAKNSGVILLTDKLATHEPYEDSEGNIHPGGVFISGSFIAKHIPDYKEFIAKYGIEAFKETIDPEILKNVIGYRIPNQGLASNDALEIIGILPEETGDTIVAYTGITTKTGSDFDIDKMYLMLPSFEYTEGKLRYIKYLDKLPKEIQSKEAIQNRLIETYKAVLINKKVLQDVMTPIDFDYVKNMILHLYPEKVSEDISDFNSFDDIILKYEFKAGKAGVGQEANALVDHVRGMMADLSFNKYSLGIGHENALGETDFDREFSVALSDLDMKENNISEDLREIRIANTLSAILNAFVDIAKDPYITRGNWTTLTTNTGNMLLRAGVHPEYVTSFLAQPILKDYVKFANNRESKIVNDTGKIKDKFQLSLVAERLDKDKNGYIDIDGKIKTFSSIYKTLVKKAPKNRHSEEVEGALSNLTPEKVSSFIKVPITNENRYRFEDMINKISTVHRNIFYTKIRDFKEISLKELKDEIKGKKNNEIQLSVLDAFFKFQEKSKMIRDNVMASKLDVSGMGKNYTSLLCTYNLIQQLQNNEINDVEGTFKGFKTKLIKNGKLTLLGHYKENVIDRIKDIMEANPKLFFTANNNVVNTFNEISKDVQSNLLIDSNLGDVLEQEYYSYLLSGFEPFKLSNQDKAELINNLPNEFKEFKNEHKADYLILEELGLKVGQGSNKYIGISNRKKSSEYETELTDSWNDLLNDYPEMAEKLIKYSYFTSGFKMNKSQFYTLIPYQWFVTNKINEYLTEQSKNVPEFDNSFLQQLYKNNVKNSLLVPNFFTAQQLKTREHYPSVDNFHASNLKDGFKLDNPKKDKARFFIKQVLEIDLGLGETDTETLLYQLKGYDKEFQPIYVRTNPLGLTDTRGNKVVEYGFNQIVTPAINPSIKVNMQFYNQLQEDIVYPFDYFNQYIKVDNNIQQKDDKPLVDVKLSDQPERINIYAGANENKELSNMAIRPFRINYGASYTDFDSVEQAFQAAKREYAENNIFNDELEEKILNSKNSFQIKKLGNEFKGLNTKSWNKDSSKIMKRFILESFKQNEDALKLLLDTNDALLTHNQDSSKWGIEFPKLLMEVRDELSGKKEDNSKDTQLSLFNTVDNSKLLWDKNEKAIIAKFPDLTLEEFSRMSEEEQQNLLNCL